MKYFMFDYKGGLVAITGAGGDLGKQMA